MAVADVESGDGEPLSKSDVDWFCAVRGCSFLVRGGDQFMRRVGCVKGVVIPGWHCPRPGNGTGLGYRICLSRAGVGESNRAKHPCMWTACVNLVFFPGVGQCVDGFQVGIVRGLEMGMVCGTASACHFEPSVRATGQSTRACGLHV